MLCLWTILPNSLIMVDFSVTAMLSYISGKVLVIALALCHRFNAALLIKSALLVLPEVLQRKFACILLK